MSDIRMVDLTGQYLSIRNEIDDAIHRVVMDSAFIKGKYVASFENNLSRYLDVKHVIGVGNGTDAIQIALMALGIGPGDEVIAPSFTFVATAEAAALLGATPVFADIDPVTFNLSPESVEPLITPATRAILPVHLYGQPADMKPIMALAERYNLRVIEDAAQAIGARYHDKAVGTMGDLGTFSFFPSKNLGCFGDGGAIVTNDNRLADSCRLIASHGSKRKYHNEVIGMNSRLDGLQAAILDVKLKYLDTYNAKREEVAVMYGELLAGSPHITVPSVAEGRTHVFHQYTVRFQGPGPDDLQDHWDHTDQKSLRDSVSAVLRAGGIPHAIYYPVPVHRLPVYESGLSPYRFGDMTHTETVVNEVLSLPMHTEMSDDHIHTITSAIMGHVVGSSVRIST